MRRMTTTATLVLATTASVVRATPPDDEAVVAADEPAPPDETPTSAEDAPRNEVVSSCLTAFQKAQLSRNGGAFLEAEGHLERCSAPHCPDFIAEQCTTWLDEARRDISSVTVIVVDDAGDPLDVASIAFHGPLDLEATPSRSLRLDAGRYHVLVTLADGRTSQQDTVVVQGMKDAPIQFVFSNPPPSLVVPEPGLVPSPSPASGDAVGGSAIHPLTWVALGVGAAGLIAGTVTGTLALDKQNELVRDPPRVDEYEAELDEALRFADASTGTFVVGGAGLVAGVVLLILDLVDWEDARSRDATLCVRPISSLGTVGLEGSF